MGNGSHNVNGGSHTVNPDVRPVESVDDEEARPPGCRECGGKLHPYGNSEEVYCEDCGRDQPPVASEGCVHAETSHAPRLIDSPFDLLARRLTALVGSIEGTKTRVGEGDLLGSAIPPALSGLATEADAILAAATSLPGNPESFARRKLVSSLGFAILHLCTGNLDRATGWAMKASDMLWTIPSDPEEGNSRG